MTVNPFRKLPPPLARAGIGAINISALTHSTPTTDIGLDFAPS